MLSLCTLICRQGEGGTLLSLKKTTVRGVRKVASGPPTVQNCFRPEASALLHVEAEDQSGPSSPGHQWGWRRKYNLGN